MPAHDLDVLGGSVEDVALHGLDFPHLHSGTGLDALQHDLAGVVCIIHPVIRANSRPGTVYNLESHASQGFIGGTFNEFADDEGGAGFVVKNQAVRHAGAHHDIFWSLV